MKYSIVRWERWREPCTGRNSRCNAVFHITFVRNMKRKQ